MAERASWTTSTSSPPPPPLDASTAGPPLLDRPNAVEEYGYCYINECPLLPLMVGVGGATGHVGVVTTHSLSFTFAQ